MWNEVTATIFGGGVDRYFDMLQEGKVYTFERGVVKFNNRKFNHSENKYQLSFDERSTIKETVDDFGTNKPRFTLVDIGSIQSMETKKKIDVGGLMIDWSAINQIVTKKGDVLLKRAVTLADTTGMSIELTVWNEEAQQPEFDTLTVESKPVLVVKNAQVGDFNGRSISTIRGMSSLHFNPEDLEITAALKGWGNHFEINTKDLTPLTVKSEGKNFKIRPISSIIEEMDSEITANDHYFDVLARIRFINHDENRPMWYESCKNCRRKVVSEDANFRCHSCGQLNSHCEYRFLTNMRLQDSSNSLFATAFEEAGNKIFKMNVLELKGMQESNPARFEMFMKGITFKEYVFRIKAKKENTENGTRVKYTAVFVRDVDSVRVSRSLLGEISEAINNLG